MVDTRANSQTDCAHECGAIGPAALSKARAHQRADRRLRNKNPARAKVIRRCPRGGDSVPDQRPVLLVADCGFASTGPAPLAQPTGDTVDYRPYQEVAAQHPSISLDDFRRAVQALRLMDK